MERREQVTGIGIVRVNGQPEELDGSDGRRQPSFGGTSRISREAYVRFCERLGVKFPGPTRLVLRRRHKRRAVREMKVGPSRSPCRGRLQTAISCFGPMAAVVDVMVKRRGN